MKTAAKVCLWVLAFVPLVMDPNVFSPYSSGKNLLIEFCLVLAGILILINFFYFKDFRDEITRKVVKYLKNPLVLSVLAFISIFIISTIFAVDKYSAFWGDLSRAEGLAGMLFFFSFFVFSLLVFEKKDWLWFFKLSLFATLVLLFEQFRESFGGLVRPGSLTGNPTFLAGYLLFSISASLIVLDEVKGKFFKFFSILIIILSIIGIFLAETRGTILGLGFGILTVLIYCAFKGGNISYKKLNLQKISIIFLCVGIIFSGIFFLTRKSEIWQKVPGLSRVAVINTSNTEDISTPVRLYLYKSSIASVNPTQNGWKKFLLGWGPENFILAESKNYDVGLYNVEPDWHDRAHNKFLDLLVMNGIFGLLAYLSIWFFYFKFLFKKFTPRSPVPYGTGRSGVSEVGSNFSLINLSLLFFGVSLLTHLLFVFDQITTSIPFFTILAFIIYFNANNPPNESKIALITSKSGGRGEMLVGAFLSAMTVFLGFVLFTNTFPGYVQMRSYIFLIKNSDSSVVESKIDSVFAPFTTAQMNIRGSFLKVIADGFNKNKNEVNTALLNKATTVSIDYADQRPFDIRSIVTLANSLNSEGFVLKNLDYLKKGEGYFRQILELAPNKPDVIYGLAVNLAYQKKYAESFDYFEKAFDAAPSLYNQDGTKVEDFYTSFVQYFYEQKDKDNFIKTANRLKANNYADSALLDKILNRKPVYTTTPVK